MTVQYGELTSLSLVKWEHLLVNVACGMTVLGVADVFVLGIMGAPAGKLSLWYGSSMGS